MGLQHELLDRVVYLNKIMNVKWCKVKYSKSHAVPLLTA